ncbi:hypothetical protein [Streptomyces sp. CoT10]|uniref:hypothetical protein n=1 Tax=Streptomyces sp. CoT10 TaxID=2875762 RepID=UPI001CD1FC95|nr:hypothetical protein [Streptomyces sp. CoT10]
MADRSDTAKARHGQWVFTLATAEPPEADVLKAHKLTRKDAWPNFTRFLIAVGTRWGTWGEDIRPSLDRIEEATGVDRSKADRWLKAGVSLDFLAVARQGSRGVATTYRIATPGEKPGKAPQGVSRKPRVPRQAKGANSASKRAVEPSAATAPVQGAEGLSWADLSPDAQGVFMWPPAEREKLWKPEYGDFEAAKLAAVEHNPWLPV